MHVSPAEISGAIESNQFVPYFQPLVDLRQGELRGFEVLARWQHPTLGLVPPNLFIPIAEEHNLINALSMALFRRALSGVRTLPTNFGLSINLAPGQLHDRSLPDMLHGLADDAEFDMKRLTVEVTESALLQDLQVAALTAGDLKALGVRLSLDDFGTGYSSLLHLQALPFDELKIDLSFVSSMVESRQSRKITAAVVNLGLSLGLQTVGEGIEDRSQANLLLWQGCNVGQGWLYGRPTPAEELPAVIAKGHLGKPAVPIQPLIADTTLALEGAPSERLSQLQAIYDSAPVGLCFIDRELRYVNLNQRLAEMQGMPIRELVGRKLADVVPAMYMQIEEFLQRALKGESCPSIELVGAPAQVGGPSTMRLASYQPVLDETGEVLGVCLSIGDITEIRKKKWKRLRPSLTMGNFEVGMSNNVAGVAAS